MAYRKLLVDNLACNRRFHLCFDDQDPKEENVEIRCKHCDAVIFSKSLHPPVKFARDENLVTLLQLSDNRTRNCQFKDHYPQTE